MKAAAYRRSRWSGPWVDVVWLRSALQRIGAPVAVDGSQCAGAERVPAPRGPDPEPGQTVSGRGEFQKVHADGKSVNARDSVGKVQLAGERANRSERRWEFEGAQGGSLRRRCPRLLVVVERYPDLKSIRVSRAADGSWKGTGERISG